MTDLCDLLAVYVHAHQTGNSVPPHIDAEARAVLARWGSQQPPCPIPVSERLPGLEDCDEQGRCWFYTPASSVMDAYWVLRVMDAYWVLRKPDYQRKWETHWLPANALPLPKFYL